MGSYALSHLGELADKGPIGIESRALWDAELARRHNRLADTPEHRQAKKNVTKGKLLGTLLGAAAATPFAVSKKNFLLPIIGAMAGRSAGEMIAEKKNPKAEYEPSAIDEVMGQYGGLFSPEQRQRWMSLRNSPQVRSDPRLQAHIAEMISEQVKAHPEYRKHEKHKSTIGNLGKIIGAGAVLAAMLFGKKKGTGLLAKPGGLLSGNTAKAFAGMGLAGGGLAATNSLIASRRAGLKPKETASRVADQVMGADTALNLGFYAPAFKGAPLLRKVIR